MSATLIAKYLGMFQSISIKPDKVKEVDSIVSKINSGKAKYENISSATGVPWFFIGLIHYMESGCNFTKHLHNGDPLTARTVQVPKGYPKTGKPPFTFFESAVDALKLQKLHLVKDWSVGNMLLLLENFNGPGYRNRGVVSPYLWSYSTYYTKGKYVADSVYDPNAVSKQAGVAVIMKRVFDINKIIIKTAAGGFGLLVGVAAFFF